MKNSDQATDPLDGIKLVPEPSEKLLNERQYLDYRSEYSPFHAMRTIIRSSERNVLLALSR